MARPATAYFVPLFIMSVSILPLNAEIIFLEGEGIQLVSTPQSSPADGLVATIVSVRAINPNVKIDAFASVSMLGNLHQVWPGESTPTVNISIWNAASVEIQDWRLHDSHILISPQWVRGIGGCGFNCTCGFFLLYGA